jgi:hypothetical protein
MNGWQGFSHSVGGFFTLVIISFAAVPQFEIKQPRFSS